MVDMMKDFSTKLYGRNVELRDTYRMSMRFKSVKSVENIRDKMLYEE